MCDLEFGSPSTASRVTTLWRSQRTKLQQTTVTSVKVNPVSFQWMKVEGDKSVRVRVGASVFITCDPQLSSACLWISGTLGIWKWR